MKTKMTPQQKEVIEQMKAKDLIIRYVVSYGRLDAYFYNAPVFNRVNLRVFDSLRSKGLIEEDGSAEYWRLSPLAVGVESKKKDEYADRCTECGDRNHKASNCDMEG